MRQISNKRGSSFFLCRRAKNDPTFPRYPRLPVLHCRGFENRSTSTADETGEEEG